MKTVECYELFVDGADLRARSGRYFITSDPSKRAELAEVTLGDAEDVAVAVQSANQAFPGWTNTLPALRGQLLASVVAALRGRREELARLESLDNGKPLAQARSDVEAAAWYFEFYGGMGDKIHGETIPAPTTSPTPVVSRSESRARSSLGTRRSSRRREASPWPWRQGTQWLPSRLRTRRSVAWN